MQSIQHIKDLISHQLNPDPTTQIHEGTFKSIYLQVGAGEKFPTTLVPGADDDLPHTIATCVREFCHTNSVTIKHNIRANPLREKDQFLVPLFLHQDFTSTEQGIINRCPVYILKFELLPI